MAKAKVGIVGGTGYTGVELLRLLAQHPNVEVAAITSRGEAGKSVSELFPNLRGHLDLAFIEPDPKLLAECDLVFYATPNGTAMKHVPELLAAGTKVVDLAADFRLKDPQTWEKWYGMPHDCADVLQEAVYGLCEINREQIKGARLVANPGCYPTATQLGYIPLIENGLIDTSHLVADCKSGVTGAGRGANVATLYSEVNDSFKAYGVAGHRHQPEIKQGLMPFASGDVGLTFVPHLVPMSRGILATLYGKLVKDVTLQDIHEIFQKRYQNEMFVDVMPAESLPETRMVKGSNMCRMAVHKPLGDDTVVVLSVIDNVVKGAAGQAIQNMNLMLGFEESAGLMQVALLP